MTENEVKLLKQCNLGSKMAVSSIRHVIDSVKDKKLKSVLEDTLNHHETLGSRLHELLNEAGEEPKDPNMMEEGGVAMGIGMKMMTDSTDSHIADIISDGASMGQRKVRSYINKWHGPDSRVSDTAEQLIDIERRLVDSLAEFL